ncbi:hypothetical protein H100_02544 [Trichophyton rubrum MR850]|nr:hypothetical protein H100_02544 [Trichophyton rubrum MR850]
MQNQRRWLLSGKTSDWQGARGAKKPGGTNKECLKEWRLNKTGCGGGVQQTSGRPGAFQNAQGYRSAVTGKTKRQDGGQAGRDELSFFSCFFHESSIFGMLRRQPSG